MTLSRAPSEPFMGYVVLYVPEDFPRLELRQHERDGVKAVDGSEMETGELDEFRDRAPPGFRAMGWKGEFQRLDERLGFKLTWENSSS